MNERKDKVGVYALGRFCQRSGLNLVAIILARNGNAQTAKANVLLSVFTPNLLPGVDNPDLECMLEPIIRTKCVNTLTGI